MKKILQIIILSFLLGGCSQIKWDYRFSAWIIQSRLESIFVLQGDQVKATPEELAQYSDNAQSVVINYIMQQLEQQHKGWIGLSQSLKR